MVYKRPRWYYRRGFLLETFPQNLPFGLVFHPLGVILEVTVRGVTSLRAETPKVFSRCRKGWSI